MKKLIFLFMMLICAVSLNAQESITYTDVVDVEGKTKNELYDIAKVWFATTYNSANDVLQMDNKETGVIIGNALFTYNYNKLMGCESVKGSIKYTIKLYFKDNKYKYEITNFIHDPYSTNKYPTSFSLITIDAECNNIVNSMSKKWSLNVWNHIKSEIERNMIPLIANLKNGMTKQVESVSTDW